MAEQGQAPKLLWDHGTAYDFFASLLVIHTPAEYGLRASWAAGIRSRLSTATRELFITAMLHLGIPVSWLYAMPGPKTARAVLDTLEGMKPEEILPALSFNPGRPEQCEPIFRAILDRGQWSQTDLDGYKACIGPAHAKEMEAKSETLAAWLDCWTRPAEFGRAYRAGLREFYEVFFREEERRIQSDVERALVRAKEMAGRLTVRELFEELSQGIRVDYHTTQGALILVPCYWCSPRILYTNLTPDQEIVLFGARPPEASLIPGDLVPAQLLLALEALSDPTRLSILKTIIQEPLTQADIARKLRLRPPTISHHLKPLRIAGLIAYIGTGKDETRYGARLQQIEAACAALKDFLSIRS
jgi:DNA-binding transcriptional ArsR family regulator